MPNTVILKTANRAPRVVTVVTGDTVSLLSTDSNVMIYNAGASIAGLTLALPVAAGLPAGKEITIGFAVAVTTLTWSAGSGNTFLKPAPTTQALNTRLRFLLDASNRWCLC